MTPERQAEIIVGNCCMCRNPDIITPNPDMCRECKLRKSIEEALSALTRERDEAREKVADQIVPGCASVTGDPVENAAEAHKRIEKERDELKADYLKLDAYCAPLREVISDLKARCEKAEKVVSAVRKMREANFQEFFTAYREAIEAVDAADALTKPEVKHDNAK